MAEHRYAEFGKRLRGARKASGLSMAKVTALLEVSSDALYKYERGEVRPGDERASVFIEFIGKHLGGDEARNAALALVVTGRQDGSALPVGEAADAETLEWVRRLKNLSDGQKALLRVFLEGLEGTG